MTRRERYIAKKNNPSDIGNYDIDQLYNRLAPGYSDVEKFSTPSGRNPIQVPFFLPPDDEPRLDLPKFETTPLKKGDPGSTFYPDEFRGFIPKNVAQVLSIIVIIFFLLEISTIFSKSSTS